MVIVVDGYNVLKQAKGVQVTAHERDFFIKECAAYAKKKSHNLMVIFDGGQIDRPERALYNGIAVVYVGRKQSADDYIKLFIAEQKNKELLLVSSDRELRRFARNFSIESIDALSFYQLLGGSKQVTKKIVTTSLLRLPHASRDEELAAVMEQETELMPSDRGQDASVERKKGKSISKQEKKLLRVIKKL